MIKDVQTVSPTDPRDKTTTNAQWVPSSWRAHTLQQPIGWPSADTLKSVTAQLSRKPPIVAAGEADALTELLGKVQRREAFALFAGDCAESFDELTADRIRDQLRLLLQMKAVLTFGAQVPVIMLGRLAGQFSKPRTDLFETKNGVTLPSFRGHSVNDKPFTEVSRTPDPNRLLAAHSHSASALNLVRAFTAAGYTDLSRIHAWTLDFVRSSPEGVAFETTANAIDKAIGFAAACGQPITTGASVYTAHEALVLDYEEALTRIDSTSGKWYDCSGHFVWVGERSRAIDGAHVEFARGVNNPIGVKIGPECSPDELVDLIRVLNPLGIPGRLSITLRLGATYVEKVLPDLVGAVKAAGESVVWICDPMHGNTQTLSGGVKTRDISDILREIEAFFSGLYALNEWPGGIHLETTPEDVTECTGGSWEITEDVLSHNYRTLCDPRLNARQAIEVVLKTVGFMQ